MTYFKSNFSFFFLTITVLFGCSTNPTTKENIKTNARPNYLLKYLNDNNISRPQSAYVFILYTDRCQTCNEDNIDYIIKTFKDRSKIFILNFSDSLLEQQLLSYGTIFIDPYDKLTKYGLNSVDNQVFFIDQDTVQFSSLLNNSTKARIEEQAHNTK